MRETEQNSIDLLRSEAERILRVIDICHIDNEFIHEYDASAIYVELSRKEARENLTDDPILFDTFFSISTEINNLAGTINSGKDYDHIAQQLEDFQLQINNIHDESALKKYVQQWLFSVKALFMYRIGKYEEAVLLTDLSIDIIDELINKYKVFSFVFRLVLQYSNLSNIYFKTGDLNKAADIRKEMMDYLFRGQCNLSPKSLRNVELWNEMEFIREYNAFYYFKTTVDRISYYKSKDITTYRLLFNRAIKPFMDIDVLTLERYYLVNWMKAETEFVNQNNLDFLFLVEEFFEEDINSFFKFLAVYILESIGSIQKIHISDELIRSAKIKFKNIDEDLFHEKQL